MIKFIKFGIVGIFNTIITIGSYMVLVFLGVNYLLANIIGYILGVINSHYWNKSWVFQVKSNQKRLFLIFVLVNLGTLGINTTILFVCVHYFYLNSYISQIFATGIGLVFNFVLNKVWTFRNSN